MKEELIDLLKQGNLLYQALDHSKEKMEEFYSAAYQIYEKEEFQKASDAFFTLTVLDPGQSKFWLGLGMSEQYCERYLAAVYAYAMSIYLDIQNPLPHFLMACCYEQLNEPSEALAAANLALHYAESQDLISQIHDLKQRL